jgi:hypothetical protein
MCVRSPCESRFWFVLLVLFVLSVIGLLLILSIHPRGFESRGPISQACGNETGPSQIDALVLDQ